MALLLILVGLGFWKKLTLPYWLAVVLAVAIQNALFFVLHLENNELILSLANQQVLLYSVIIAVGWVMPIWIVRIGYLKSKKQDWPKPAPGVQI